eukprot:scaffold49602_cov63-Phaeocystis_antarctica.AAC.2
MNNTTGRRAPSAGRGRGDALQEVARVWRRLMHHGAAVRARRRSLAGAIVRHDLVGDVEVTLEPAPVEVVAAQRGGGAQVGVDARPRVGDGE